MPRGPNAQLAVDMFEEIRLSKHLVAGDAWKAIAQLLLTCEIWESGRWQPFHNVIVYRERNDFKIKIVLQRAESLTTYLSGELGINRSQLCSAIARYWKHPQIAQLQPNNPIGHAFRSITAEILSKYGSPHIAYTEEVDPHMEFPGFQFHGRSVKPKIDIVARKGTSTVAIISTRWRYRHDRVDLIDEAHAYVPARRNYPNLRFYGHIGELSPARVHKVLSAAPPLNPHGPITAVVHFNPKLITVGLGENSRMNELKSLEWLINETFRW